MQVACGLAKLVYCNHVLCTEFIIRHCYIMRFTCAILHKIGHNAINLSHLNQTIYVKVACYIEAFLFSYLRHVLNNSITNVWYY